MKNRSQVLEIASLREFDLIVIGGGIVGAGAAQDAVSRGLSVLLVERADFASGMSSRTAKLIEGGLKHLTRLEIRRTREQCRERATLGQLAPHLVRDFAFVLALPKKDASFRVKAKLGLTLYDFLSRTNVGSHPHDSLNQKALLEAAPALSPNIVVGGLRFHDCITDDSRLVLEVLKSACNDGAHVLNYMEAVGFERESGEPATGRIRAVHCRDRYSGQAVTFRCKLCVVAAGAWTDVLRRKVGVEEGSIKAMTSKVTHIMIPPSVFETNTALYLPGDDHRAFTFVVPWHRALLVGSMDAITGPNAKKRSQLEPELRPHSLWAQGKLPRQEEGGRQGGPATEQEDGHPDEQQGLRAKARQNELQEQVFGQPLGQTQTEQPIKSLERQTQAGLDAYAPAELHDDAVTGSSRAARWLESVQQLPPAALNQRTTEPDRPDQKTDDHFENPLPTKEEIDYLLDCVNRFVRSRPLTRKDVIAAWSGLWTHPQTQSRSKTQSREQEQERERTQALLKKEPTRGFGRGLKPGTGASQASDVSPHAVQDLEVKVLSQGVVSVVGGDLTNYRIIASHVLDKLIALAQENNIDVPRLPSRTKRMMLGGWADKNDFLTQTAAIAAKARKLSIEPATLDHLIASYGKDAQLIVDIVERQPGLNERICPDFPPIMAEVAFCVLNELAVSLEDILFRRMRLGMVHQIQCKQAAPKVASLVQNLLQWDDVRTSLELQALENTLDAHMESFRDSAGDPT
jgi:glycerol-3-phosphate dehydrogenase